MAPVLAHAVNITMKRPLFLILLLLISFSRSTGELDGEEEALASEVNYAMEKDQGQQTVRLERTRAFRNYVTHGLEKSGNTHRLVASGTNQSDFTLVQCQDYRDFHQLLYTICNKSTLCSELYSIDDRSVPNGVNFRRFAHQLSLSQLFVVRDLNRVTLSNEVQSSLFILEDGWPTQWLPHYLIELQRTPHSDDTAPHGCSQSINLYAMENQHFVVTSLHLMQTFKVFVANTDSCGDINERLVVDPEGKPHCECKNGKSCNSSTNYEIFIIVLLVLLCLGILAYLISMLICTARLLKKMDSLGAEERVKQKNV